MRDERLEVSVTFDSAKGYIASAPELLAPVVALSLSGSVRWTSSTKVATGNELGAGMYAHHINRAKTMIERATAFARQRGG
jgi:hypothetical protein